MWGRCDEGTGCAMLDSVGYTIAIDDIFRRIFALAVINTIYSNIVIMSMKLFVKVTENDVKYYYLLVSSLLFFGASSYGLRDIAISNFDLENGGQLYGLPSICYHYAYMC